MSQVPFSLFCSDGQYNAFHPDAGLFVAKNCDENNKKVDVDKKTGEYRSVKQAELWHSNDQGATKTQVSLEGMSGMMRHGCMVVVDENTLFVAGGFQLSTQCELKYWGSPIHYHVENSITMSNICSKGLKSSHIYARIVLQIVRLCAGKDNFAILVVPLKWARQALASKGSYEFCELI